MTRPNQPRQILLTAAGYYPFGPVAEWVYGNGRLIQRTLNQNYQPGQRLWKRACEGSIPQQGKWDYWVSGWKGVPLYLHDYSNLLTAGHTGNIAVTFMGSYDVRYQVAEGALRVQVTNSSSIQSATHPPVLGYTKWWSENIGDPLNRRRSTGPMSEKTQMFNLTFDLSQCGCER